MARNGSAQRDTRLVACWRLILLFPVFAAALPAAAQQSDDQQSVRLQAVEVTGSRIKRSESEGTSPVLVLSSKDLEASGIASVGELLQKLSVSGSSLNTKFNSAGNFGFPADGGGVGSGSTTISLRNLSAKRTLVLVDGLRWVNESSASGVSAAVDLNTLPLSVIDRVEILTDGASSLYGSDAIAGVVNLITKKSQDGGAIHAYYGDYTVGDGQTWSGDISMGGKSGKLNYFIDLSHYDQQQISSSSWGQSSEIVPGGGVAFGSSATPTGHFIFSNPDGTNTYGGLCPPDSTGTASCNVTPNGTAAGGVPAFPSDFHSFSDSDRFNYAPYNLLLTPSRRTAIFAQSQYEVADSVRWYLKGLYQARVSTNQAAPEPIFFGPGSGTGIAATVGVDVSNPYNPLGYTLDPNSNFVLGTRRPLEGGPRLFDQSVDTRYISTGFTGELELFDRLFSWDLNYANGQNDAKQQVHGTYNIQHIKNALGPVGACTAPCVPLNIFGGPGTITPAMLQYIQFIENDESSQTIDLFTANVSGSVVPLPAGSLDFATGYEHRRLEGSYSPDSIVIAGESNGVPSLPTSGEYSVDEWYLELSAPLLADEPAAKALDLSLATRWSNYSTFGSTWKSKFGLRWQPYSDLTIRGTFAQGFRAPSIGELDGSPARFDAVISDPCSQPTSPTTVSDCAALGVPSDYESLGNQISVQTGGNTALKPETSKSWTTGFVFSPSFLEHLAWSERADLQVSYYKITVDNAIQAPDAQTVLNRCVASADPDSAECSGITRDSHGYIVLFEDTLQNLGTIDTQGFDIGMNWAAPRKRYGAFSANWQTTYVASYKAVSNDTGLAEPKTVGVEYSDSGIPRWRSTLRFNWALQPFSASWALRYMSALTEQCGDASSLPTCDDPNAGTNRLHSVLYDDVQASYQLPIKRYKTTVSAGVNNVFDAGPPQCLSCSLNGYDASNYDLPGRFWYVEAAMKF